MTKGLTPKENSNKMPKGPHNVHLSTMCTILTNQPGRPFLFTNRPEKYKFGSKTLISCFLSSFIEFRSVVSEEKLRMSQPLRDKGGHLFRSAKQKNTNLVEYVIILLLVKFRLISLSGFREEVKHVSANQRPGGNLVFLIGPKNTN